MFNQSIPKTLRPFFWHYIKKQWRWFLAIQLLCFGWSLDHTLWPVVMMEIVDSLINFAGDRADVWSFLAFPLIFGALLWISVELSFRLSGILQARAIPRMEADIRMEMFNYVQHHSYRYFSEHLAGSIANKIADMPSSLTRVLVSIMSLYLPVLLAILISTALLVKINILFAAILFCWIIIHMGICYVFSGIGDRASNIHSEARTKLAGKIVDSFTNNNTVRLFSRYPFERGYLAKYQEDEQLKHKAMLWTMEKMKLALGLACILGPGIAMNWYMIYCWQQGRITTGEVVFIFNTTWNITFMAWIAGLEMPTLFKDIGVCHQALTVIQDAHDVVDRSDAKELKVTKGEIIFDNVTFQYTPHSSLFQNKSIKIHPGQKVGLVGFSGSGKTTFVHLILRLFDIKKGRILIDGQDVSKVTQQSLRAQIALIPQDPILFHRTLKENIHYGKLEAGENEVLEAAKKAHCHDFIDLLPEKYQTMAGERGLKLSGGQRQRIAIARAILKDAPILILDEATSALDSVTEKHIQEDLKNLMQNRTTLVIAHRLSTLSDMDRILVFKEGKIIEDGPHEELLQGGGHYAHLWALQAGGFIPDAEEDASLDLEEYPS